MGSRAYQRVGSGQLLVAGLPQDSSESLYPFFGVATIFFASEMCSAIWGPASESLLSRLGA